MEMTQILFFLTFALATYCIPFAHADAFINVIADPLGDVDALISGIGEFRQPNVSVGSRSGYTLPLYLKDGHVRNRGLLRNGSLPMGGSVGTGFSVIQLMLCWDLINPDILLDCSTITYIPCSDCKHCGKHQDPGFDPEKSSSVTRLKCHSTKCNCGSPKCQCMQGDMCYYSRFYAEKSSSAGFLMEDRFDFPDSDKRPVDVVFGCVQEETGLIFSQAADGIMGMGNNNNAFQSQLVEQKIIDNVFSLCYGFPAGGAMLLVDGKDIGVNKDRYAEGYGSVFDSGTTFTYLPTDAFQKISKLIKAVAQEKGLKSAPGSDPSYNDICWQGAPTNWDDLESYFPPITFKFAEGAVLTSPPYRYLFKIGEGKYCLGLMDNGHGGTLIGGVSVRNVLVQYDRRHNRMGFLEVDCNNIPYSTDEGVVQEVEEEDVTPKVHVHTSIPSKKLVMKQNPPSSPVLRTLSPSPVPSPRPTLPSPSPPSPSPPSPSPISHPQPLQASKASPSLAASPSQASPAPPAGDEGLTGEKGVVGVNTHGSGGNEHLDENDKIPVIFEGGEEEELGSGPSSMFVAIFLVAAVAITAQLAYTYRQSIANLIRSCAGYQTIPEHEPYSTSQASTA
eukprot:gene13245-19081_t